MIEMEVVSSRLAFSVIGTEAHVLYKCSCEDLKPICKLYFCRHCIKLRCSRCVMHEVDSFFCPNCLENMPSAEAKLKKNRCANCYNCPSCGNTLSVRASAVALGGSFEAESLPSTSAKKMHYLLCTFCRWSTRDVNLPDQASPSGGWSEVETENWKKVSGLLDYYKSIAHQDKLERERQKLSKRRSSLYLMDRYGYALTLGKKRTSSTAGSSSALARAGSISAGKESAPPDVCTTVEVAPISDDFYTENVVLENVLNCRQRFDQVANQPALVKDLYPRHKHLMVRRSQRCKECEHNLCKPEFNPSSIKFKIQLGAVQYCPQLRVVKIPVLTKDKESEVALSITNPIDSVMHVTFAQVVEGEFGFATSTCEIKLPKVELGLAAKDATLEYDEVDSSAEHFDDDASVVVSRSNNKVTFLVRVTPATASGDVKTTFKMIYRYKMVTTALIRKADDAAEKVLAPEEHLVTVTLFTQVNLGPVATEASLV